MILAGLALCIVALVPVVCAALIFFTLRPFLGRRDWVIVALAGIIGFSWYLQDNALGYGWWLLSFLNVGESSPGQVPVTVLLCLGAVFAGISGAVLGSSIAAQVPDAGSLFRRKKLVEDSITPKKSRRESLKRRVAKNVPMREIPAIRGPYATEKSRKLPLKAKTIPLGLGMRGRLIRLSTREMGMHGCVVGSTGSGKTITLMWIIGAALDMGFDVTVLDMKEDTEPGGLRDFLRAYSSMHQVPLQEIALGDEQPSYWFNVLADMTADESFDTIMSLVEFDDAYWKALNRKVLQQVIQLCHQAAEVAPERFTPPTMLELGKIMEQGRNMKAAVKDRVNAIDAAEGFGYCKNRYTNVLTPSDDEAKSAGSFGTKLTGLYDSTAGRRILVPGGDRKMIDVRLGGLTYVGLNSLGQPDMAKILSSSALQRLSVYAAQRIQGRAPKDRPRLIVVDEANFIARDIAMNMLSRVRSALFNMILCTQGPTDWIDADGDDWSRLTQNINWLIAMAQSSPESAEKCAEFLGERDNNQLSQRVVDGQTVEVGTVAMKEEFIVTAKELRDLGTGEGYLRVNKPESRVAYVCMPMRTQELTWYEDQQV
ncbi:TraM recognition domain-containing protein [Actinomadura scrupuli]|uniref:type IV secretory system conjugative DNA transfer family protein n=1 Tax=Actinomadura scrupuli TaxID=559629 RepID=UPI003D98A9EA